GRKGGMPQMVFEYILKKQGIDPFKDLNIIQNIDFGLTSQAFASGQGDYTMEFEPAATALELEGVGKVVASLGVESGKVPYTAFSAKKSYIEKNSDVIQKFTNAIQRGMNYVQSHSPEEIAKAISGQFKETDEKTLVMLVTRYYEQDTWKDNLIFEEASLTLLQDILEEAGELEKRVPYEAIITTEYAKEALKK
ncbi:MAG: ABC transporter substrate-binding protein, partial [Clostridiales bacterium]|nr:ABC transporter substrate-binding protein [Clostridiales bacterium]